MRKLEEIQIADLQIDSLIVQEDYSNAARLLIKKQLQDWPLLKEGHESLQSVKFRTFPFKPKAYQAQTDDSYKISFQFNPKRITSSSAKVDKKSIKERECFLCFENLPIEQKGILYKDNYFILANPFPIFPEHFTVSNINHIPQSIENNFGDFLELSKDLSKHYTVFYNGPECGASAPDHLHFQAGSKYFMPIDDEFYSLRNEFGEILLENENIIISAIDDRLRKIISFEGNNKAYLHKHFIRMYNFLKKELPAKEHGLTKESMMNIISFYEEETGWRVLVFLREKHRSHHYFEEGDKKLLWSPAAVDLGGVCITPLEKDFVKINEEIISEVFDEIMVSKERFHYIKESLLAGGEN